MGLGTARRCVAIWYICQVSRSDREGRAFTYRKSLSASLKNTVLDGFCALPEQFDYVYKHIKQDLHLASISGGTDICGCFVLGNPISPVYRGECQQAGLGVDIKVFNSSGDKVNHERGELVCTNSYPTSLLVSGMTPESATTALTGTGLIMCGITVTKSLRANMVATCSTGERYHSQPWWRANWYRRDLPASKHH